MTIIRTAVPSADWNVTCRVDRSTAGTAPGGDAQTVTDDVRASNRSTC
jgi:hypothetical protein